MSRGIEPAASSTEQIRRSTTHFCLWPRIGRPGTLSRSTLTAGSKPLRLYWSARLDDGATFEHELEAGANAFLLVLESASTHSTSQPFPAFNKMLVLELARCEYILRRDNIIALGNSGTG